MTREDFVTRWRTRQSEWARVGALVDGARVYGDVLQDFEAVRRMTPSYRRQRPSRGTRATIFVGFTGWACYQLIVKDGTCSSARAI